MPTLRFLQFSDLHLDSNLTGSRLQLPAEKRARINRDIAKALTTVVDIARTENVDVVLCPGDLWDDESVSFESAAFAYDCLAALAPIPVILAPGNHDPYHAFSYHHPAYYRGKTGTPQPRNVTVFSSQRIERRTLPSLPYVDFYGCCFEENVPRTERVLRGQHPAREELLSILVMHASQDDAVAPAEGQQMCAPFSREELLAAGFHYAALGHYHRCSEIFGADGVVRGAYSGIPVARTLAETGPHCVLVGEVDRGGVTPELLRKITLDPRRVLQVDVPIDASVMHTAAAKERIETVLREAGASHDDIVCARLTGRMHPELSGFDFDEDWRDALCFHLMVDASALEPDYDIDALLADDTSQRRVEGRFAARMKQLLADAGDDPQRQRMLRAAMCYGFDALRGKEVELRHVD